jgi:hypothetical protein
MTRPRIAAGALLALGSLAGARLLRRRGLRRRVRLDLYYDDGAMISLEAASPDAEPVLARAREALDVVAGR